MKTATLFRVIRFGFQNFFRNFWLSAATVSVLTLTVISINTLLVLNVLGKIAVSTVEAKVDISAHFRSDVDEGRIQTAKVTLLGMQEVRDVEYVSPEDNLLRFREINGQDSDLVASLDEVGENPFGATLIIKARNTADYPAVLQALSQPLFTNLIEEQNFEDHETMVARLNAITSRLEIGLLVVTGAFVLIALMIIINAIRVSIYTHREEIGIMRLVGASNWFIRGPFYVEALIWTVLSVILTLILLYPLLLLVQPFLQRFFGTNSIDLVAFYLVNAPQVIGLQLIGIALMTLVTSKMATARYLRI
ncbi:ABC transporter permease [Patescibacteria group bacterium]|nr:ABC transporter permease [Patescibacteria group bacterium]MBU1915771.1 ABC transporter permease [Patescibacteria group bacterium]